ncbi:hypothetical protein [Hazenella coriacea]|uniref:Uncharacterized protein n=1 Tax=Hazenella coriacea TaxID=1179467 RepID=A0A4R3LAK7_9BACL|nr:hypothetical protein [Hazenella coriacea]TCS96742.1 hypothetical protein EDD58_101383 [Hazenella coriacea]
MIYVFGSSKINESVYIIGVISLLFNRKFTEKDQDKSVQIGDYIEVNKTVTSRDIFTYLGLTDEQNPLFFDENVAAQTPYQQCLIPPGLLINWLGTIATTQLVGSGSIMKGLTIHSSDSCIQEKPVQLSAQVLRFQEELSSIICHVEVSQSSQIKLSGEMEIAVAPPLRLPFDDAYNNF